MTRRAADLVQLCFQAGLAGRSACPAARWQVNNWGMVCCKWECSLPACCVQAGAELVEQFAAEKAAGWSVEREEYVMQCTGCADRTAAADALKVANGNVDTVCHLRLMSPRLPRRRPPPPPRL